MYSFYLQTVPVLNLNTVIAFSGLLADKLGSYVIPFQVAGSITLAGAFIPFMRLCCKRAAPSTCDADQNAATFTLQDQEVMLRDDGSEKQLNQNSNTKNGGVWISSL